MSSVTWFTIVYKHHNIHIFTIIDQLNMNDTIKYIMYIGSLPWVLSWIWPSLRYSHCSLFLVHCSLFIVQQHSQHQVLPVAVVIIVVEFLLVVSITVSDMLINWRLERHLSRVLLVYRLSPRQPLSQCSHQLVDNQTPWAPSTASTQGLVELPSPCGQLLQ